MAFTNDQLDADLATIIGDLPTVVVIGGVSYNGTRMSLTRDALLQDEGLRQEYRFSVYVRSVDVGTLPTLRTVVTIGSTDYRVLNADVSDADRLYRLDLGEEYASR